jgi:hypothetical protein
MSDLLGAAPPLLVLLLPTGGAFQLELAENDPPVLLDRAAFEDALLATAQQAAEAMPRGGALRLLLERRDGGVALAVHHPEGMVLPGLDGMAALARASGGTAEATADGLRFTLPAAPAAG